MSRVARPPALWPWASLLIASLGVIGAIVSIGWPRALISLGVASRHPAAPPTAAQGASEPRRIRLFFPQDAGDALKEQERDLVLRGSLADDVRAVLQVLASSDGPGVRPPLPQGLEVRQVFLDAVGILYLDLAKGIQSVFNGPDPQPGLALSAIVTTLTTSFSEVKRVQFLSEGQEVAEVVRGVDLRRPVAPRFPGEEDVPATSRSQESQ